ncbi:MAG: protein-L-isoaspartate O-methyltransferase [Gammaproteobacteria bacterium]|jgi:protein-L-isoaspartate(D-aspartate) O-methyltransferase
MDNTTAQQHNSLEIARFNMVEQQIRPAEVLDPRVLDLISEMPREDFVPADYRNLAYADIHIPIGYGQTMLKPIQEARFLQALNIQPNDKVLEIGTGSGFMTALLAKLADRIISVEIVPELAQQAKQKLTTHNINNVIIETGDAANGWEKNAPYDVIVVTGSIPLMIDGLKNQLAINGRMCVTVGKEPVMTVYLFTRVGENQWREEALFETVVPALQNVQQPEAFVF